MRRSVSRRGFTLIELLVVIAILTILAGILFPVFSQVRERARQAVCVSNLRQVSMGMRLYEEDYDNRFPPVVAREPAVRKYFQLTWMYRLGSYVKISPALAASQQPTYRVVILFSIANALMSRSHWCESTAETMKLHSTFG